MTKRISVMALVLVLLGSSASLAVILDSQGFLNGYGNGAMLIGGPGAADSTNINTVGQYQQNQDAGGIVRTVQAQNAGNVLAAGVGGIGDFGVVQDAGLGAGQIQFHNGDPGSLGSNVQFGGVALGQAVGVGPGPYAGVAFGLGQSFMNQFQIIATPFGTNVNTADVTASMFDAVGN